MSIGANLGILLRTRRSRCPSRWPSRWRRALGDKLAGETYRFSKVEGGFAADAHVVQIEAVLVREYETPCACMRVVTRVLGRPFIRA